MTITETLTKEIEGLKSLLEVAKAIETKDINMFTSSGRLIVSADGKDGLRKARKYLREALGTWTDKIVQIWHSYGEQMQVAYRSKTMPVEIWVCYKFEEVPLKKGCTIKKSVTKETGYTVVCGIDK